MSYYLAFGSYVFPAGFYPSDDGLSRIVPVAKLPRAHGARILDGYAGEKRVRVRGGIIKGPLDRSAWRTRVDALKAALSGTHNLYFETDRYYRNMQAAQFSHPFVPTGYGRIGTDMEIEFVGGDPRAFDVTTTTDNWSSVTDGASHTISGVGGNVFADPILAIAVSGSGTQSIDWTFTNQTTGQVFTLRGSVTGGDNIIVDCVDKTVEIAGVDKILLFDGEFLTLEPGSDTIEHETDSGSVHHFVTYYQNRHF